MSDYETDALLWSDKQAELLRRVARGEAPNETPDWANIIDEVQDVGLSEVRAVESLLYQAMLHLLKQTAWPGATATDHWDGEIRAALAQAERLYRPSMRQRIDLDQTYRVARRALPIVNGGSPPQPVPLVCPYTLESLFALLPPG